MAIHSNRSLFQTTPKFLGMLLGIATWASADRLAEVDDAKLQQELQRMASEARVPVQATDDRLGPPLNHWRLIEAAGEYCRKHHTNFQTEFPEFWKTARMVFAGYPGPYDETWQKGDREDDWCLVFRDWGNRERPLGISVLTLKPVNAPRPQGKAAEKYTPELHGVSCEGVEDKGSGTVWVSFLEHRFFAVTVMDQNRPRYDEWFTQKMSTFRIGLHSLKRLSVHESVLHRINYKPELLSEDVWPSQPGF